MTKYQLLGELNHQHRYQLYLPFATCAENLATFIMPCFEATVVELARVQKEETKV
jgi:hypothetical protein